jgi:hydroxyethylthiazole kinase-like sugar kinase family protein
MRHLPVNEALMFFPWHTIMMLAIESSGVVGLRLMKLASGGGDAQVEAELMLREKIDAAFEAGATLIAGGSMDSIVDRYREHVSANSSRLLTV